MFHDVARQDVTIVFYLQQKNNKIKQQQKNRQTRG